MKPCDFFDERIWHLSELDLLFDAQDEEHYKMARFADYTIKPIEDRNMEELEKCFNFIETRLVALPAGIHNALNVSYLEALLWFETSVPGIEFKKLMPQTLYSCFLDYKRYYNSLR